MTDKTQEKNLDLWNRVEKTDPTYTTDADLSGRKITSIDAYYQMKNATAEFGAYGSKWGLKNVKLTLEKMGEDNTICLYSADFYYPDGEFPINNAITVMYKTKGSEKYPSYVKIDTDFAKKIETNTITKALSKLGFNADIFIGKFEDPMYVKEVTTEFENEKLEKYMDSLEATKTIKELEKVFLALPARIKINKDIIALKDELKKQHGNSKV